MKKTIITSLLAVVFAVSASAQGFVNWGATAIQGNTFTAQTNTSGSTLLGGTGTGGTVGGTTTLGGSFYYALLYTAQPAWQTAAAKPTTVGEFSSWSLAGNCLATNSTIVGQVKTMNPNAAASVPWANGVTNSVMMVGWSGNLGSTWASALSYLQNWATQGSTVVGNAFFGMSTVGYINPGTSSTLGVNVFSSSGADVAYGKPILSLNTQLYMLPVPEPSTLALAGLGGLAMLALRRKK